MYSRLLQQMMVILKGSIMREELMLFVFQLIAWARLSKLGKLSGELAFNPNDLPRGASHISTIFKDISESGLLNTNGVAFGYVNPAIQHLSAGQLLQALELLTSTNLDDPWQPDDLIPTIGRMASQGFIGLPSEVTELMVGLAKIKESDKVYLPFEQSFQLTTCVQKVTPHTFSETPLASSFPWLVNLLCDIHTAIHIGDSLENPGFLDEGRLVKFDTSVSFPPFGVRYSPTLTQADRFNRFPEQTSAVAVLSVRHLLARTKSRIVVAVPNGLLFSPGVERALRDDLLVNQQIEAIIALPPALLAGSAIQFSLMVLRNDKHCNDIVFIDGCNDKFSGKDGKGRATLTGWQAIVEAALNPTNNAISRVVSVADVQANDAQLQVSRYCKTSDDEAIEQLLSRYPTKTLSDIVSFVRPIPLSPQDGTVSVWEVAPADFPEYGYTSTPGREIKLSEANLSRGKNQFLRPLDIAVSIKGNVCKVAIMSKDTPKNAWVIGQSCIVLRVDETSFPINPHVIFSYMNSEVGQLQLRSIVSGAAVSVIQLRELEKIKIPLPDATEAKEIINSFEKIAEIEKAIADYRDQQQQISKAVWRV